MKCPTCKSPFEYKGGENKKDHGCNNMSCPVRREAYYCGNVSVRPNWWFAESYHIPFKYNNIWFCVIRPLFIDNNISNSSTCLYKINLFDSPWAARGPKLENIWSIPYMALPVNEDFNKEFDKLINRFDRYLNKLLLLK